MDADGSKLKLTLVQMNSGGSREENLAKAAELIDAAAAEHRPDLLVVPEFFNSLYVFQYRDYAYIDHAEPENGSAITMARDKARSHGMHLVATIFEEDAAGICYDSAILIGPDGAIVGKYRKTHPAAVNSLEKIYFRFGSYFPVFRVGAWRVGMIICYDTCFPETARCVAVNGAELILVPFAAPQPPVWREMMITRAFENGAYFAPCNKVGREGEWMFGGQSMIVGPSGEVIAEAGREDATIITATLDRRRVVEARRSWPMFRDRRPDLYAPICTATESIPKPD